MKNKTFLVDYAKIYSREDLLAQYIGQTSWVQVYTDVLNKALDSLVPGQMVTLKWDMFYSQSKDVRGPYASMLDYPRTVQRIDAWVSELSTDRIAMIMERNRLELEIGARNIRLGSLNYQLLKNAKDLKEYSDSKGVNK